MIKRAMIGDSLYGLGYFLATMNGHLHGDTIQADFILTLMIADSMLCVMSYQLIIEFALRR